MEVVKPNYSDLTHTDLLRKCFHGKTQNPNESFNNLIWRRLPKKCVCWPRSFTFNEGNFGRFKVLQELDISPGPNVVKTFKCLDNVRIKKSQRAAELQPKRQEGEADLLNVGLCAAGCCLQANGKPRPYDLKAMAHYGLLGLCFYPPVYYLW
ncbi:hypothetical protein PR048_020931 [Dryococelus australis]|uniref:Uncharacterized protein n=1 Tax=Dryococelus australis TaxID=614101 RepID=A0ABQ9GWW2_9NEOP|nr:hypothetical protein PR048_020931 [Dryococelus australis]